MKETPLYQAHLRHGGRMVAFAGYLLPLQYTSIVEEHLAVRREAGLFDVSHMGEFLIRGEEALAFLQWATVNDASRLKVGRAQYSMLPNERGGVVDDIYLYRLGEEEYLMVVNAANIAKDFAHLKALSQASGWSFWTFPKRPPFSPSRVPSGGDPPGPGGRGPLPEEKKTTSSRPGWRGAPPASPAPGTRGRTGLRSSWPRRTPSPSLRPSWERGLSLPASAPGTP